MASAGFSPRVVDREPKRPFTAQWTSHSPKLAESITKTASRLGPTPKQRTTKMPTGCGYYLRS